MVEDTILLRLCRQYRDCVGGMTLQDVTTIYTRFFQPSVLAERVHCEFLFRLEWVFETTHDNGFSNDSC